MSSKKSLMARFGREVRRRREAMGLTIERFAERAALTSNYIGTIEHGLRDPCMSSIFAISHGLGIAPGELFGDASFLTPPALALGKIFDESEDELRSAILLVLRAANSMAPVKIPPEALRNAGDAEPKSSLVRPKPKPT